MVWSRLSEGNASLGPGLASLSASCRGAGSRPHHSLPTAPLRSARSLCTPNCLLSSTESAKRHSPPICSGSECLVNVLLFPQSKPCWAHRLPEEPGCREGLAPLGGLGDHLLLGAGPSEGQAHPLDHTQLRAADRRGCRVCPRGRASPGRWELRVGRNWK